MSISSTGVTMNRKMRSTLFVPFCMLLPFHANSQTPSAESLLRISNKTYMAFQAKDVTKMRTLTTSDFTYVGGEGILTGAELGKATEDCILRSFALSSPKVKMLSSTSAILTYIARQDESCRGKPAPPVLFNADVLVRRGGKWLVSTHMEASSASPIQ